MTNREERYYDEIYKGKNKLLYIIDMNNGFVNFGPMANPKYNDLVQEQLKMLEKFKKENQQIDFILEAHDENATEFIKYPKHCIRGTEEADLIPEFQYYQLHGARTYYKNSINGMLNKDVQGQIKLLKGLKENLSLISATVSCFAFKTS